MFTCRKRDPLSRSIITIHCASTVQLPPRIEPASNIVFGPLLQTFPPSVVWIWFDL
jgi:hypothetical protein